MTKQSGNVLFLILIAVALFAALSYAVTSSSRSGGGNATQEKLLTDSAALIQYPTSLQGAVTRMMVSNGIAADELFFDSPANFSSMTPAQLARQVFHPSGGGAIYQSDWIFGSCDGIRYIGTSGSAALSTLDIVAYKFVSSSMCTTLNKNLGVTDSAAELYTGSVYNPSMSVAHPGICSIGGGGPGEIILPELRGKDKGCFIHGDYGRVYYHVLVAR